MGVVSLKHHQTGGGSIARDVKGLFSVLTTTRTKVFTFGFMMAFVLCTTYIVFCGPGGGAPSLNDFFSSGDSYRDQFSSFLSHFFSDGNGTRYSGSPDVGSRKGPILGKNSTSVGIGSGGNGGSAKNQTNSVVGGSKQQSGGGGVGGSGGVLLNNQTKAAKGSQQTGISEKNQTETGIAPPKNANLGKNQTLLDTLSKQNDVPVKNQTAEVAKTTETKSPTSNLVKNQTKEETTSGSPTKEGSPAKGNSTTATPAGPVASNSQQKKGWNLESLKKCDIFHGRWVKDDSYPMYKAGSCPHIDEPFNCFLNGRPELSYQMLRWQPNGCNIPRLNATDMLERLRGKRLVFVGDSLNRNMWESLVCVLKNSVEDKSTVFEASGRHEFRTEGSYSFLFKDYGCTVEFFRSPFLVQEWETPDTNGTKKETLRLDIIEKKSSRYKDADVIVFNTGHWWTHDKTSKGKDYYQEGNRVYSELNVIEAFHKALNTWANWVDLNINPKKSLVFFRGYSSTHFSGGRWNSGGQCDSETEPISNEKYRDPYPPKMDVLESVLKGMRTPVSYLNITTMTGYRKDAHPSIYRKPNSTTEAYSKSLDRYQDCSHWCLPGVPDSWNELLYAQLLIKQHQVQ